MSISMEYCCSKFDMLHLLIKWLLLPFTWLGIPSACELSTRNRSSTFRNALNDYLHLSTYDDLALTNATEETTCAVCLSEVQGSDSVWKLRNCDHVFHKGCLDAWLDHDDNFTCPLCRAPLLTQDHAASLSSFTPEHEPTWEVEKLLYLFGDDLLLS